MHQGLTFSGWRQYVALPPVVFAWLCLASTLHSCLRAQSSDDLKRRDFSFDTRLRYNSALVNKVDRLNVLVASRMGRNEQAVQSFTALGGKVGYRWDPVGYFWGGIPTHQLPKLLEVADIVDFELDGPPSGTDYIEPTDSTALKPQHVLTRQKFLKPLDANVARLPVLPTAKLEGDNPYLPWHLMGVPAFLKDHQTFDGRGTTVAIIEDCGDLLHPTLQTALTLNGKPVPKIAGIVDVSSEDDVYYDDRRHSYTPPAVELILRHVIRSATNTSTYEGTPLILPSPGSYRVGRLDIEGRAFYVLWSPTRNSVWVDTNQNSSFADEVELKDINQQFSAAEFPAEKSVSQDQVLAVPTSFAIAINKHGSKVKLFVNQDDHATSVASIIAGNHFFGSNQDGIAPGARILYVTRGLYSVHETLKAFIAAASRADVDVINASFVIKPVIPGETVTSLILNRVANVYQKPMFFTVAAASSATTDNISDQGTTVGVFGIMGYATPEMWDAFHGVTPPLRDNDPEPGGEGPAINGAVKPDLLLPFYQIAASNCISSEYVRSQELDRTASGFLIPPCYMDFGGTSGSTADASGLAALLISAAKQSGMKRNLARLSWAIRASAKYLDQMPEPIGYQGYGLPDLPAAWKLLAGSEATPSFIVSAASNGPHESERKTPHVGMGIYEYAGWHPGMTETTAVTVSRRSGVQHAKSNKVVWRGNDGTFTAPVNIELPYDEPTKIDIAFAPKTQGVHQAILQIVDPENGVILHSFLNTVVASDVVGDDRKEVTWQATIPLAHEACSMVDVAQGVSAISADVSLQGTAGSFVASLLAEPPASKGPADMLNYLLPNQEPAFAEFQERGSEHIIFANPAPGTWAFCIRNHQRVNDRGGKADPYIKADLKIRSLMVTVRPTLLHRTSQQDGHSSFEGVVTVANRGATLKKPVIDIQTGFEESHSLTISSPTGTTEVEIHVTTNTQKLLLDFESAEHTPLSGIGVSVYFCLDESGRRERCSLQDYRESPLVLEYKRPESGRWIIALNRLGDDNKAQSVSLQFRSIQTTSNEDDNSRAKVNTTVNVGELLEGSSVTKSFEIGASSTANRGSPVAIIEVYDSEQEAGERVLGKSLFRFHPERSRPAVLGRAIEPLSPEPRN